MPFFHYTVVFLLFTFFTKREGRILFKGFVCLSSIVLLSATAQAADVAANREPAPVVAAHAFSWRGFYAGGQIGGSWSDGGFDREVAAKNEEPPANVFVDTRIIDITSKSIDGGNFIGGVYAGYNYQWQNNIVIGLDADIVWTTIPQSRTKIFQSVNIILTAITIRSSRTGLPPFACAWGMLIIASCLMSLEVLLLPMSNTRDATLTTLDIFPIMNIIPIAKL